MSDTSHTQLLPYQASWKEKFQTEKEKLQNIFGDKALKIEHIGSTSIEGLLAKPIIDIAVMVKNHEEADEFTESLSKIGYKFDSMSTERHYYTKGSPDEFHLSIAYIDRGGFWERQILFRDYLRSHSEARDEYAEIKVAMLLKDPTGSDEYIAGKSEFVQKILKLAKEEILK
jgi:GrpB-like predicted nucleotidyltransferase (UPF0157 family)